MDTKSHSDIDYNELIRGEDVYAGRGDNIGGHTYGLNSTSYGVCVIGQDGDATEQDLASLQERYEYACAKAGRELTVYGHGEAPGQAEHSGTDCPGREILGWIHEGLIIMKIPPDEQGENWTEELVNNLPECRLGHHDPQTVKTIQGIVNRDLGPVTVLVDGVWGPKTDEQVGKWQSTFNVPNSVKSDGNGDRVFGRQCWTYALTLA
jgi:peptidoglycan hydrolase-like protein with peptidoglycan-binding domain